MFDVKRKQGYQIVGESVSGYPLYRLDIWNTWDSLALYKSLSRRPNEDNITLRKRILAAEEYGSTTQGLVNFLSDSFDVGKYVVADKKVYYSTYPPLSYMQYNKLKDKTEVYYPPRVIINGDTEIIFPEDKLLVSGDTVEEVGQYLYNYEKTIVYNGLISWTLWKDINQGYHPLWETNSVPSELVLKYQYVLDGTLYIIEESAKQLARDADGNIIEE